MKRVLGAIVALLIIAVGAAVAAVGALGLSVFGTDGTYTATGRSVDSAPESVAVIADLTGVEVDLPYHELLGEATLSLAADDGSTLFLGQADQAAVDDYLFGSPYDLATKNGSWTLTPVAGINTAVAPPTEQSFWTQSAVGKRPSLTLQDNSGPQTLVVMHADGQPGVSATITLGFTGERIGPASIAAVAVGLLLILLTFLVILWRRRARRRAATAAAAPAATVPQASPAGPAADADVLDLAAAPEPAAVGEGNGDDGPNHGGTTT
jgi:hypothetical protein